MQRLLTYLRPDTTARPRQVLQADLAALEARCAALEVSNGQLCLQQRHDMQQSEELQLQLCQYRDRAEALLVSKTLLQEEVIKHLKTLAGQEAKLGRLRSDLADAEYEVDQLQVAFRCTAAWSRELEGSKLQLEQGVTRLAKDSADTACLLSSALWPASHSPTMAADAQPRLTPLGCKLQQQLGVQQQQLGQQQQQGIEGQSDGVAGDQFSLSSSPTPEQAGMLAWQALHSLALALQELLASHTSASQASAQLHGVSPALRTHLAQQHGPQLSPHPQGERHPLSQRGAHPSPHPATPHPSPHPVAPHPSPHPAAPHPTSHPRPLPMSRSAQKLSLLHPSPPRQPFQADSSLSCQCSPTPGALQDSPRPAEQLHPYSMSWGLSHVNAGHAGRQPPCVGEEAERQVPHSWLWGGPAQLSPSRLTLLGGLDSPPAPAALPSPLAALPGMSPSPQQFEATSTPLIGCGTQEAAPCTSNGAVGTQLAPSPFKSARAMELSTSCTGPAAEQGRVGESSSRAEQSIKHLSGIKSSLPSEVSGGQKELGPAAPAHNAYPAVALRGGGEVESKARAVEGQAGCIAADIRAAALVTSTAASVSSAAPASAKASSNVMGQGVTAAGAAARAAAGAGVAAGAAVEAGVGSKGSPPGAEPGQGRAADVSSSTFTLAADQGHPEHLWLHPSLVAAAGGSKADLPHLVLRPRPGRKQGNSKQQQQPPASPPQQQLPGKQSPGRTQQEKEQLQPPNRDVSQGPSNGSPGSSSGAAWRGARLPAAGLGAGPGQRDSSGCEAVCAGAKHGAGLTLCKPSQALTPATVCAPVEEEQSKAASPATCLVLPTPEQAMAVLVAEKQELQQQVAALKRETELLRFKLLSDEQGLSTNSTTPAEGTSPQGTPSPWGYASPHGAWAGMSGGPRRLGYTAELGAHRSPMLAPHGYTMLPHHSPTALLRSPVMPAHKLAQPARSPLASAPLDQALQLRHTRQDSPQGMGPAKSALTASSPASTPIPPSPADLVAPTQYLGVVPPWLCQAPGGLGLGPGLQARASQHVEADDASPGASLSEATPASINNSPADKSGTVLLELEQLAAIAPRPSRGKACTTRQS